MAVFQIVHEWKRYQATVVNASTDTFKMILANDAPAIASDSVLADITPITEANGYTHFTMTTTWVETGAGIGTWSLRNNADKTWTASGGSFGPFQYVWIDDDTVASPVKPLVGYWDVGAATTITTGNSFLVDLDTDFAIYDLS